MKAHAVKWFILLALNTKFFCSLPNPFTLENESLTAMEGSCVEIKCKVSQWVYLPETSYWFWMKDAVFVDGNKSYAGTVIYSTNEAKRSVSPQFKSRVNYTGSSPEAWRNYAANPQYCSILICNLNKTDSGNYTFRFIEDDRGKNKWITKSPTNLKVTENPCPITFNKPDTVLENNTVTLSCSTISSCPSFLQISPLLQQLSPPSNNNPATRGSTTHSFKASWTDDGKEFSCKTNENTDSYLIKNVTLTVNYGPKAVTATQSSNPVKENSFVTLRCSAKGSPAVTFNWFKGHVYKSSGAEINFTPIKASDSGFYSCEAQNQHGNVKSNTLNIDVLYAPEVGAIIRNQSPRRSSNHIEEGDQITLECILIRSNPLYVKFIWKKDEKVVGENKIYVIKQITPEHSGNYTCEATNSVGSGTKNTFLQVRYKPRSSIQLKGATDNKVKINSNLQLICETKAHPEPDYSWYSYTKLKSQWKWLGTAKTLTLYPIKKEDEACYICNATNSIGKGAVSQPACIQVLYPPTNVQLTLPSKVRENQSLTITCSAESSPLSDLKIRRSSSPNNQSSEHSNFQPADKQNALTRTFSATEAHAGVYICEASNTEGSNRSSERKLEVEYPPKDVKIEGQKVLEVEENKTFSLSCSGRSNPPVTSYRWIKTTGNKNVGQNRVYSVKSASLSDDGLYSCEAENQIGTRRSQQVEVKIMYAPKLTTINKGNERQLTGGRKSIILSCISHSYPAATFVWYNKTGHKEVSREQNLTVYSNQAGEFYCTADNRFGKTPSDSVKLFNDSNKMVKIFILSCFIILVLLVIFFLYKRNKSNQQGTTSTRPFCGFLPCWTGSWRTVRNETMLVEPFRSRDDLLPEQPSRLNVQQRQQRSDVTSASNISSVYATVNVPHINQSPSAQKPAGRPRELLENDSVNYASLHFKKKKKKKPEEDAVYSKVCKPKACKENKQQSKVYENFNISAKPSYSYEDDSGSSEDEEELSYSEVNFQPKPGHQRATRDSSSSEDTRYSQVKL